MRSASLLLAAVFITASCGGTAPATQTAAAAPTTEASAAPATPAAVESSDEEKDDAARRSTWRDEQQDREIRRLREEVFRLQEEVDRLKAQGVAAAPARPVRRNRPDPNSVYAVPTSGNPWKGDRDGLVTIVRGYEYACPFCERSRATMDQILKDYKGEVRVVYKNFIVHPSTATEPAHSACAAHLQGFFPEMDKLLWDEAFKKRQFDRKHIEGLARRIGLNMQQFRLDRDNNWPALIKRDQADLKQVGVSGTPSFFINGRFLSGARPFGQFKTLIDDELAKAKEALRRNRSLNRGNYYDREVLGKGLTALAP